MLTVVENTNNSQVIAIPPEEMEKLGLAEGDEVEFSKNENNEIILRNAAEAERKRRFEQAKNKVFEEWDDVFIALARGADDASQDAQPSAGKFVLSKSNDKKYKFVLINSEGRIIFESSLFESQEVALKAINDIKTGLSEIKGEILNFPVNTEMAGI